MTRTERERRHQANLERINEVQLVAGRGDRMRLDHEGTLLERARLWEEELCSHRATEAGLAALDRLLRLADEQAGAQAREIAGFVAALRDRRPVDLGLLRVLSPDAAGDVVAVLDAYRWGRLSLIEQVEGGPRRVARVLGKWQAESA